jgi:hypothetical protein
MPWQVVGLLGYADPEVGETLRSLLKKLSASKAGL